MEQTGQTGQVTAKYPEIMPEGLAKVFYESKIFKDIHSEAQAIVKILAGREMGLSPIQSMNSVYIVESKIGYEIKIFLSKIKKSGKYDYSVKFEEKDGRIEWCEVTFYKLEKDKQICIGSSKFTFLDAAKIGLANKSAYKNYPRLMMFYRAASNGMKMYCPEILDGVALAEDYIELMPEEEEKTISFNGEEIKTEKLNDMEYDAITGELNEQKKQTQETFKGI